MSMNALPVADAVWRTFLYLRLWTIGAAAALALAVFGDHVVLGHEVRSSISAYVHSDVRAVFIGVLVSVGVLLIVHRGESDVEDVLLNLAGLGALVVGLAPTADGRGVPVAVSDGGVLVGLGALAVVAFGVWIAGSRFVARGEPTWPPPDADQPPRVLARWVVAALMLSGAVFAVTVWVGGPTPTVQELIHRAGAITLFVAIFLVALTNGDDSRGFRAALKASFTGRRLVAWGMAATFPLSFVLMRLTPQWLTWTEGALIGWFALYWMLRTRAYVRAEPREIAGVLSRDG